jgi:hypothetical protein
MSDRDCNLDERAAGELFAGDTGKLPEPARRILVSLLREPYISVERNAEEWPFLSECRADIESILNDLFLELYVDGRNGIAYCLPVSEATGTFPKLKREHELTELQSLLVVFLRQQYLSQTSAGADKVWVDGRDMREHLGRLFSEGVVNYAASEKKIGAAIEYMRTHRYIEAVKGADERYRVLPIIETAFPLEKVEAILEAYKKAAGTRGGAGAQGGAQDGARGEDGSARDGE